MPHIQKLSWEQFEKDVDTLSQYILQDPRSKKLEYVLIITRGGLVPGYFIAQNLKIKKIKTICLESYTPDRKQDSTLRHMQIDGFSEKILEPEKWLIVDEIADSGKSISFVKSLFPNVLSCCLYTKNTDFCDFYGKHIEKDAWIDFPWEKYE